MTTLRNIKNNPLTHEEVDENFRELRYDMNLQKVLENGNTTNNSIEVPYVYVENNVTSVNYSAQQNTLSLLQGFSEELVEDVEYKHLSVGDNFTYVIDDNNQTYFFGNTLNLGLVYEGYVNPQEIYSEVVTNEFNSGDGQIIESLSEGLFYSQSGTGVGEIGGFKTEDNLNYISFSGDGGLSPPGTSRILTSKPLDLTNSTYVAIELIKGNMSNGGFGDAIKSRLGTKVSLNDYSLYIEFSNDGGLTWGSQQQITESSSWITTFVNVPEEYKIQDVRFRLIQTHFSNFSTTYSFYRDDNFYPNDFPNGFYRGFPLINEFIEAPSFGIKSLKVFTNLSQGYLTYGDQTFEWKKVVTYSSNTTTTTNTTNFSVGIRQDNTLWYWGNTNSFLSLNQVNEPTQFTDIPYEKTFSDVAVGNGTIFVIDTEENLFVKGLNSFGQLGLNDVTNRNTFIKLNDERWKNVFTSEDHVYAIKVLDESLWGWGRNEFAQLGIETRRNVSSPVLISKETYTKITPSKNHTIALKSDGTIWSWGSNDYGKLGVKKLGDFYRTYTPLGNDEKKIEGFKKVVVTNEHTHLAISNDNILYVVTGKNDSSPGGTIDLLSAYDNFEEGLTLNSSKWSANVNCFPAVSGTGTGTSGGFIAANGSYYLKFNTNDGSGTNLQTVILDSELTPERKLIFKYLNGTNTNGGLEVFNANGVFTQNTTFVENGTSGLTLAGAPDNQTTETLSGFTYNTRGNWPINLPWTVIYNANTYSSIHFTVTGILFFGSVIGAGYFDVTTSTPIQTNPYVGYNSFDPEFGDKIVPRCAGNYFGSKVQNLWTGTIGSSPNRQFILRARFQNVGGGVPAPEDAIIEIRFFENDTRRIDVHYVKAERLNPFWTGCYSANTALAPFENMPFYLMTNRGSSWMNTVGISVRTATNYNGSFSDNRKGILKVALKNTSTPGIFSTSDPVILEKTLNLAYRKNVKTYSTVVTYDNFDKGIIDSLKWYVNANVVVNYQKTSHGIFGSFGFPPSYETGEQNYYALFRRNTSATTVVDGVTYSGQQLYTRPLNLTGKAAVIYDYIVASDLNGYPRENLGSNLQIALHFSENNLGERPITGIKTVIDSPPTSSQNITSSFDNSYITNEQQKIDNIVFGAGSQGHQFFWMRRIALIPNSYRTTNVFLSINGGNNTCAVDNIQFASGALVPEWFTYVIDLEGLELPSETYLTLSEKGNYQALPNGNFAIDDVQFKELANVFIDSSGNITNEPPFVGYPNTETTNVLTGEFYSATSRLYEEPFGVFDTQEYEKIFDGHQPSGSISANFIIDTNKNLYTVSTTNANGRTGLITNYESISNPTQITVSTGAFKSLTGTVGAKVVFAIQDDGQLYAWGGTTKNSAPQFPNPFIADQIISSPILLDSGPWKNIFTGHHKYARNVYGYANSELEFSTTYAIAADKTLFGWGKNKNTYLNTGLNAVSDAVLIKSLSKVKKIFSTEAWGANVSRMSDDSTPTPGTNPYDTTGFLLDEEGKLYGWGSNSVQDSYDFYTFNVLGTAYTPGYQSSVSILSPVSSGIPIKPYNSKQITNKYWKEIKIDCGPQILLFTDSSNVSLKFSKEDFSTFAVLDSYPISIKGITTDGELYFWGSRPDSRWSFESENYDGTSSLTSVPTLVNSIPGKRNWSHFSKSKSDTRATYIFDSNGDVYALGYNTYGNLGLTFKTSFLNVVSVPTLLPSGASNKFWVKLAHVNVEDTGGGYTLAIKNDGTLWSWGYNPNGALALNDSVNRSSPVQVGTDTDWIDVAATRTASFMMKANGALYSAGNYSTAAQIGLNHGISALSYRTPQPIGLLYYDGGPGFTINLDNVDSPTFNTQVWDTSSPSLVNSKVIISSSGTGFGTGGFASSGNGNYHIKFTGNRSENRVLKSISLNLLFRFSISFDVIYGTGLNGGHINSTGELIKKINSAYSFQIRFERLSETPVTITLNKYNLQWHRNAVDIPSQFRGTGTTISFLQTFYTLDSSDVVEYEIGIDNIKIHSSSREIQKKLLYFKPGSLSATSAGVGGIIEYDNYHFANTLGNNFPVVLGIYSRNTSTDSSNTITNWAYYPTPLSYNGEKITDVEEFDFAAVQSMIKFSNGDYRLVKTDMSIEKPGTNVSLTYDTITTYLSVADVEYLDYPCAVSNDRWEDVQFVYDTAIGIKEDRTLWAWGQSDLGKLGVNSNAVIHVHSMVQIGSYKWDKIVNSSNTVLAIREDGTMWTWGWNGEYGELGLSSNSSSLYYSSPVQIGNDNDWKDISGHNSTKIAVKKDGSLWFWGENKRIPTGYINSTVNSFEHRSSPTLINFGLSSVNYPTQVGTTGSLYETYGQLSTLENNFEENALFGQSLSLSEGIVVVGVPGADSISPSLANNGSIAIYSINGEILHSIENPNTFPGWSQNKFGSSVDSDGYLAVVGAPGFNYEIGQAYVYNTLTGSLLYQLIHPNPNQGDRFGSNVAISKNYAVVSSPYANNSAGKIYIYDVGDGTLFRTIDNPNASNTVVGVTEYPDYFGSSVDIAGNIVVVGSINDFTANTYGSVYVFNIITGQLIRTLKKPTLDLETNSILNRFGQSVQISTKYITVGSSENFGCVYVFDTTTGEFLYKIDNLNYYGKSKTSSTFAKNLSLTNNILAISDDNILDYDDNRTGIVYIYDLDKQERLYSVTNSNRYSTPHLDRFGSGISLDGNLLAVGSSLEESESSNNSGIAYVFDTSVISLDRWKDISSSENVSFAIKESGSLWGWGYNENQELSQYNNFYNSKSSPVLLATGTIYDVGAGNNHLGFVDSSRQIRIWGQNDFGQLGNGNRNSQSTPVILPATTYGGSSGYSKLFLFKDFSYAIDTLGGLWAWGRSVNSTITVSTSRSSPIFIGYSWIQIDSKTGSTSGASEIVGLKSDKTVYHWGQQYSKENLVTGTPTLVTGFDSIEKIQCRVNNIFALKGPTSPYQLWGFGSNSLKNFGYWQQQYNISKLNSGRKRFFHGSPDAFIDENGYLWMWGFNECGSIGQNTSWTNDGENYRFYSTPVQVGNGTWKSVLTNVIFPDLGVYIFEDITKSSIAETGGATGVFALRDGVGHLYGWGNITPFLPSATIPTLATWRSSPTLIDSSNWNKIDASGELMAGIKNDNRLYLRGFDRWYDGVYTDTALGTPVKYLSGYNWNKSSFTQIGTESWRDVVVSFRIHPFATTIGIIPQYELPNDQEIFDYFRKAQGHNVFLIKDDYTLWGFGTNYYGDLGLGDNQPRSSITQLGVGFSWIQVSSTQGTTAAIRSDNTLWMWGINHHGILGGGGSIFARSSPIQIPGSWKSVSVTAHRVERTQYRPTTLLNTFWKDTVQVHAVTTDNKIYGFGSNRSLNYAGYYETDYDALTYYTGFSDVETPQPIELNNYTTSEMPNVATIMQLTDKQILVKDEFSQQNTRLIWGLHSLVSSATGSTSQLNALQNLTNVFALKQKYSSAIQIGTRLWRDIVATSDNYVSAIDSEGNIWRWSANTFGPNKLTSTSNFSKIYSSNYSESGKNSYFALEQIPATETYNVYAWGNNSDGQLGFNNRNDYSSPTLVSYSTVNKILSSNATTILTGTNWPASSNGYNVYVMGRATTYGLLGTGEKDDFSSFQGVSFSSPVQIGIDNDWEKIASGEGYAIGIKNYNQLWSWGKSSNGELGLGNRTNYSQPTQVVGTYWQDVYASKTLSLSKRIDNSIWVWGRGTSGQLGDTTTISRSSPILLGSYSGIRNITKIPERFGKFKYIESAGNTVVAISESGALFGWGFVGVLQSSSINTQFANTPLPITLSTTNFLDRQTIPSSWKNVHIAKKRADDNVSDYIFYLDNFTMAAVSTEGQAFIWSRNKSGEYGDETRFSQRYRFGVGGFSGLETDLTSMDYSDHFWTKLPDPPNLYYKDNWTNKHGWNEVKVGISLDEYVNLLGYAGFVIGKDKTNYLWSWGTNSSGCLGLENSWSLDVENNFPEYATNVDIAELYVPRSKPTQISFDGQIKSVRSFDIGASTVFAVTEDYKLWSWGRNNDKGILGQNYRSTIATRSSFITTPTQIGNENNWVKVFAGITNAGAINRNGELYLWGDNTYGQIGDNTRNSRSAPVLVSTNIKNWKDIKIGKYYVIGITEDNELYGWGKNEDGMLGLNDFGDNEIYRSVPTLIQNKQQNIYDYSTIFTELDTIKNIQGPKINVSSDTVFYGRDTGSIDVEGFVSQIKQSEPTTTTKRVVTSNLLSELQQISSSYNSSYKMYELRYYDSWYNPNISVTFNPSKNTSNVLVKLDLEYCFRNTDYILSETVDSYWENIDDVSSLTIDTSVWQTVENVSVRPSGAGTGNTGGFVTPSGFNNYIAFGTDTQEENGVRQIVTGPYDFTSIAQVRFAMITGNNSNGGDLPESGNELFFGYSTDGVSWAQGSLGTNRITWTTVVSSIPSQYRTNPVYLRFRQNFTKPPVIVLPAGYDVTYEDILPEPVDFVTNFFSLVDLTGMTKKTNLDGGSIDDGYHTIPIGFNIQYPMGNTSSSFSTVYLGTNSYLTFEQPSTVYSSLSATNPPSPKIFVFGRDNSANACYYGTFGTAPNRYTRIIYTGFNSASFARWNLIWEAVFYEDNSSIVIKTYTRPNTSGSLITGLYSTNNTYIAVPTTPSDYRANNKILTFTSGIGENLVISDYDNYGLINLHFHTPGQTVNRIVKSNGDVRVRLKKQNKLVNAHVPFPPYPSANTLIEQDWNNVSSWLQVTEVYDTLPGNNFPVQVVGKLSGSYMDRLNPDDFKDSIGDPIDTITYSIDVGGTDFSNYFDILPNTTITIIELP